MGIRSYLGRKINQHFERKYEKCKTIEEVLEKERKTEKRIKWGDRIVDGGVLGLSLFGFASNSSNRDLSGFAEGYGASVGGRLVYEKVTEDPKEKSIGRILSGASSSIVVGAVHGVAERIATGVSCELDVLQKSSFGGVIETIFTAFTSELLEKNYEYASKRIEELEKSKE